MSTATTNHIDPTNPTSKPPVSINTANKASDIIEDDLDALHKKQTMKDPHALNNASPANPDDKSKSPLRPMVKQPVTDPSPKKTEPDLTKSKRSIVGLSRGPGSLYDPFDEIAAGKSEEEVINKLKTENVKLRKELKTISDDLTVLVDKKRFEKQEVFHPPHARDYIAGTATSEKGLQKELETATKQLERLQKETAQLGSKCDAHGTYEKFQARQGHLYEIENKIQELLNQKKIVDKAFREKERVLDTLMNPSSGQNYQINAMDEDARLLRDRAREIDKRRDHLEKQAEKRKEYAQKVTEELAALKQDLKKGQDKTGFDPAKDIKSKPETPAVSKVVGDLGLKSSKKIPMFKQVEEELPCTEENFEKLKKEIKIIQKSEEMKTKKNEREAGTYQAQINAIEKNMEEASSKINERKKEVDLLTTKLKDLSRIVRHHAVVPLQEELLVSKELPDNVMKRQTSPSRGSPGRTSPNSNSKSRSTSKAKKEVQRPKPYHLLVEYAKHNFQSKGYRKDEKGKPVREEEGVNFNDRDIIGKQKVKMIALDIWHDDNGITGIQAVYENEKKEVIEGRTHVMNEDKSKKVAFETLEEDYLKEISGFMNKNETAIECLILRTFRGETMRIGTPGRDSKLFKFDINEMEYPAIIFGSLREDKNNSSRLARLGVLIATQSVEENIDSKDVKNEKDVSKEEHNKSQDQKDNTVVNEEIEGGEHLSRDPEHEEHEDHDNTHRRGSDAKSHKNEEGDHHIEESIAGNESRRNQGDPSPRKEQHVSA